MNEIIQRYIHIWITRNDPIWSNALYQYFDFVNRIKTNKIIENNNYDKIHMIPKLECQNTQLKNTNYAYKK